MENASKALIMAGEILLGIMIISIAVYVFNMFADYSSERYKEIEDTQIAAFNSKFTIYYGDSGSGKDNKDKKPIECTIHDIVGLANLAQKYNLENELIRKLDKTNGNNAYEKINKGITTENSLYIRIDLGNIQNLELKSEQYIVENLIKQNDLKNDELGKKTDVKYYKCTKCEISEKTKRVNYMQFVEIN